LEIMCFMKASQFILNFIKLSSFIHRCNNFISY
jgi:hypothetical protein